MTVAGYPRYESYKDSGVEWIGEVPNDWDVTPGRACVYENKDKNTGLIENQVLSLSYGRIIKKEAEDLTGLVPESFETYQLVKPGDIIIRGTDLQNDKTSLRTGLAKDAGIITSAYINLRPKKNSSAEYLHYLLHSYDVKKVFYALGSGLRQNLSYLDFKYLKIPLPTLQEQKFITAFLDEKCAKIDEAIRIKEEQIKLLHERRQILIQQAVTRGLNPDVPMKDSGIDWIGQIPAHWEVKPGRLFMVENKDKNTGLVENTILSLSYGEIIVKNHEDLTGLVPESYETYQIVSPRDIIIRGTDLQNDKTSLRTGIVKNKGIITSAYICLRVKRTINPDYLHQLLHSYDIRKVFYSLGSGLRQNLSYVDFKYLPITNPTASEQKEIVEYIKNINVRTELSCNIKNQQITALKEYKTTLINAAVTGKIRITPDMLPITAE